MRLVIRPLQDPQRQIDLTHRLTSVIAEELWSRYGGNDLLDWVEAELHLYRLVESVRGQVNGEATEIDREPQRTEARPEIDAERERLFLILARMDGQDDLDGLPSDKKIEPRPATNRSGDMTNRSARACPMARWESGMSEVLRPHSRSKDKVGSA